MLYEILTPFIIEYRNVNLKLAPTNGAVSIENNGQIKSSSKTINRRPLLKQALLELTKTVTVSAKRPLFLLRISCFPSTFRLCRRPVCSFFCGCEGGRELSFFQRLLGQQTANLILTFS